MPVIENNNLEKQYEKIKLACKEKKQEWIKQKYARKEELSRSKNQIEK